MKFKCIMYGDQCRVDHLQPFACVCPYFFSVKHQKQYSFVKHFASVTMNREGSVHCNWWTSSWLKRFTKLYCFWCCGNKLNKLFFSLPTLCFLCNWWQLLYSSITADCKSLATDKCKHCKPHAGNGQVIDQLAFKTDLSGLSLVSKQLRFLVFALLLQDFCNLLYHN